MKFRLFFFCCLFTAQVFGQSGIVYVTDTFSRYQIGVGQEYLTCNKGDLSLQQLLSYPDSFPYQVNSSSMLAFPENKIVPDMWIRFSVVNTLNKPVLLYLEVNNAMVDHIEFYDTRNGVVTRQNISGDVYPFQRRIVKFRTFVYPIELGAGDTHRVFMKFNIGGRRVHLPITLYSSKQFIETLAGKEMSLGFFYGTLALLSLLFFYIYYLIRERVFLLFALYLLVHFLLMFSLSGGAAAFFWPDWPYWTDRANTFLMPLSIVMGLEFALEFVSREKFKNWQLKLLRFFQWIALVIVVLSFSGGSLYNWNVWLLYKLVPVFYIFLFLIALAFYFQKFKAARIFILAFIAAFFTLYGLLYYSYAKIHSNILTSDFVIFGEMFKCVLLGLALLDRLRIFKEEKEVAQAQVINQLEEMNLLKEKVNTELEKKVEEKSIELIEKQNEVSRALIHGEEKERKRVAQELHDGMGSLLSTLRLNAESIDLSDKNLNEREAAAYQNVLEMIDKACTELRTISHNMLPSGIEHFGLIPTLRSLMKTINHSSDIRFSLDTFGIETGFDQETDMHIYRIILELINNIIKHSDAKLATVQLVQQEDILSVIVEDNGKGFGSAQRNNFGFGLISISSRTESLGGKIYFDSIPNRGTTVSLEIPLKKVV